MAHRLVCLLAWAGLLASCALVAADTMTGRAGTIPALPHGRLVELLRAHGRRHDGPEEHAGAHRRAREAGARICRPCAASA
jgi:hypothetical protein